jgi:hypothetical protein
MSAARSSVRAALTLGALQSEREVRCGTCGRRYPRSAWSDLPAERLLTTTDVHEHVTSWPPGLTVTVRRCACGHLMARTCDSTEAAYSTAG